MSRKIVSILVLLCLLVPCYRAIAADCFNWSAVADWEGTDDNNWDNVGNWIANGDANLFTGVLPPGACTGVVIEQKGPMPCINGDENIARLMIDQWSWPGAADFGVNVYSGNVNFGNEIELADSGIDSNTEGKGLFTVYGGTITTQTDGAAGLIIGSPYGPTYGRTIMYGGLISVPAIALQNGDIALYGGTLECIGDSNFNVSLVRPLNKIDVSGGTLHLHGDYTITTPSIASLITGGRIYSSRGTIGTAAFDGTWTTLTSSNVNMGIPWGPSPAMNATNVHYRVGDVNVGITLSWNSGSEANVINHDVYFGTATADINVATIASPQFQFEVNEANTVINPGGDPNIFTVSNFNFKTNTAYYWRVDDNAITSNIYDGSGNVIGSNTTLYKGQIWKFTTHDGRAYNPSPYNGRVGLTEPLALKWTPGDFTLNQIVFVGTDSATIYSATSSTAKAYRAPILPRTTSSYSLTGLGTGWYSTTLTPGTTYWWKVTEVNGTTQWGSTGLSGVTAPILWSFTPAAYINIDDFEDYNSTADMNWLNGSVLCTDPILGTYTVYPTGTMTFALDALGKHGALYYNPQPYTEVSRTYSGGSIFTGNANVLSTQPKAIRVDYIGASNNATDPTYNVLYVALEDTAGHVGVYLGDPAAQLVTAWTQWYIPLTDPNFSGVNEGAISAFHLGLGGAGRCLPSSPLGPGNDGNVMFDNIRLYASTCNPSITLAADMDGDCDVDINDLLVFRIVAPESRVTHIRYYYGTLNTGTLVQIQRYRQHDFSCRLWQDGQLYRHSIQLGWSQLGCY